MGKATCGRKEQTFYTVQWKMYIETFSIRENSIASGNERIYVMNKLETAED